MFGKLKDKLKNWFKTSTEKIEETAPKEEIEEEVKTKEKPTKEEKSKKKEKQKKQNKKIKELEKDIESVEKEIQQVKDEKIPETPLKFEVGKQKYEPDIEKIKEIEEETKTQRTKEEIKKEREVSEKVIEDIEKEKKAEQKPGFFSKFKEKFKEKSKEETEEEEESEESKKSPEGETLNKEIEEVEKNIEETRKGLFSKLKSKFIYKITEEEFNSIFDDLDMLLLENNVALEVVEDIKKLLSKKLIDKEIKKEDLEEEIKNELKACLNEILIEPDDPLDIIKEKAKEGKPFVILFFGINGTGKTTTIAKITNLLQKNNLSVVLAAADTFRAASIEQIQIHADKLKVPLIKHTYGTDPSAVGFDAIKYAEKHKINVVLIDTAGRMHTKTNLLQEMEKICRVTNPDLKIFVAESIAGNDATEQARAFHEMVEIDGSILSKADIDEKGGTIISVSHITHKPIFYLGTGQEYEDLKLFNKQEYIESLGL